ncbi:hypothetical protein RUND412_005608 [Rhizina undulata]
MKPSIEIIRVPERPELLQGIGNDPDHPLRKVWPLYIINSKLATHYFGIQSKEPALCHWKFIAVAKVSNPNDEHKQPPKEEIVAMGNAIPFYWETPNDSSSLPDSGWDEIFKSGVELHLNKDPRKPKPNALCALSISVDPGYRFKVTGIDLASEMLAKMKEAAIEAGFEAFVVPLRPTGKAIGDKFVWMDMGKYCSLTKGDDLAPVDGLRDDFLAFRHGGAEPYDPWIRKHVRFGGSMVKVCYSSYTVEGTKAEWEEWTDLDFSVPSVNPNPEAGEAIQASEVERDFYEVVIPGALVPVKYYPEKDLGVYIEPNLWIRHF